MGGLQTTYGQLRLYTLGCFANFGTFQITGRRHERPGRKQMVLLNRMVIHYHHKFIWALRSYLTLEQLGRRGGRLHFVGCRDMSMVLGGLS